MSDDLGKAMLEAANKIESRLGPAAPDPSLAFLPDGEDPMVLQLVYSLLLWESSHDSAQTSLTHLRTELCDFNELRVCSPIEVAAILPKECGRREERADRICTALGHVFLREHALNLASLNAMTKREARQYLDATDGLPSFVAARMMLVSLGGHAFPADARLVGVLHRIGVLKTDKEPADDLAVKLERSVRAADSPRVYGLLEMQAAIDPGPTKTSKRRSSKKPAGNKA
ncbi:MAG: hypothetical protein AB8F26_02545 [Phycisphaerales bacterium]